MKRHKVENNVNLSLTGTNSGVFSYIFEQIDIVEEILLKLPIKCVFRCKGVCKSWKGLISKPNFSKIYAQRSPCTWIVGARCFANNPSASITYRGNTLCLLEIEGVDAIESRFNLRRVGSTEPSNLQVIRSCNGLCCFLEYYNMLKTVTVCNPLTGECVSFPAAETRYSKPKCYELGYNYDFGYGPSTDRYKVVRMGETDTHRFFGQIFTVGVDKNWREIEDPSFKCDSRYSSVYFNGRIHTTFSASIYAFNVDEEKGQWFQYPPSLMHLYCAKLFELDGNLCMVPAPEEPNSQIDIWVMKEYGVVESWTKQITLKDSISHGVDYLVTPFTRLKDGRLLFCFNDSTNFVAYDQKDEKQYKVSCDFKESFTFLPCFAPLKNVIVEARNDTIVNPSQNSS